MFHHKQQLGDQRPWIIGAWGRFSRLSGWRKAAFINTTLVAAVFLVLLSCHMFLWAKSGILAGYQIIHSGSCVEKGVGLLNTLLHLSINILSTLVLASTNFFMQVLNAPSREELDKAHEKGSWLDIGVPSPRNAFRVSRFKTTMWILFFSSSIPIHLLFNSSIFSTDDRGSEFSYFVFDESLLTGGAIFDPGTSLSVPNFEFIMYPAYDPTTNTWESSVGLDIFRKGYLETLHPNISRSIHATVEEILHGGWHKLDMNSCSSMYNGISCSGLRAYRNVALILSGSSGWNRSQVWDLPEHEASVWDEYLPVSVNNSLWYAAQPSNFTEHSCSMSLFDPGPGPGSHLYCDNSCTIMENDKSNPDIWYHRLFSDIGYRMTSVQSAPEFEDSRISIEYCLAEPFEAVCHIGLASNLLWIVSFWY